MLFIIKKGTFFSTIIKEKNFYIKDKNNNIKTLHYIIKAVILLLKDSFDTVFCNYALQ